MDRDTNSVPHAARAPIESTLEEASQRVRQHYSAAGEPARISSSETRRNPFSYTVRLGVENRDVQDTVYIKVPIVNAHNRDYVVDRLGTEFRLLRVLQGAFAGFAGSSTVKPIAFYQDIPALVTLEAQGSTLHDLIVRNTHRLRRHHRGEDVAAMCHSTGEWLSRFQSLVRTASTSFDLSDCLEYCNVRLVRLIANYPEIVGHDFGRRFRNLLAHLAQEASEADLTKALTHNDFAPHNIIVTTEGICVLDFTMCARSEIVFDLACFWHRLESFKLDPLHSPAKLRSLQEAFLDGHGNSVSISSPAFRLACSKYHLTHLATRIGKTPKSRLDAWLNRRQWRSSLSWILSEMESAGV